MGQSEHDGPTVVDFDEGEDWEDHVESRMDAEFYGDGDLDFADPGGTSALRAAGPGNPRNLPCPTCGGANRLTPRDVQLGYQCDGCADQLERGEDMG